MDTNSLSIQQRCMTWFTKQAPVPCSAIKPHWDFSFLIDDAQMPKKYPKFPNETPSSKGSNYFLHPTPRIDRVSTRIAEVAYDRTHRLENPKKPWERTLEDHESWMHNNRYRRYSIDAIAAATDNKLFELKQISRPKLPGGGKGQTSISFRSIKQLIRKYTPTSSDMVVFKPMVTAALSYGMIVARGYLSVACLKACRIGTGFDMLERTLECAKHRIALSNVSFASHMLEIAHLAASKSENSGIYSDFYNIELDQDAVEKFSDKNFIIFRSTMHTSRPLSNMLLGVRGYTACSTTE
jgi:hypothetical protein